MLKNVDLYYFSPTGGTKKVALMFAKGLAKKVNLINLGDKKVLKEPESDLIVVAAPVFGGRIPALVSDKIRTLDAAGKKAVSLVVYGTRAYEDALLELNDALKDIQVQIIASGDFVAQHSIVSEVGKGRPDNKDIEEIKTFAKNVLDKMEDRNNDNDTEKEIKVPGSRPYKTAMKITDTPISTSRCTLCGTCEEACPTGAIYIDGNELTTDLRKCILCMACTYVCPEDARVLQKKLQESDDEMLKPLIWIYRENETFL